MTWMENEASSQLRGASHQLRRKVYRLDTVDGEVLGGRLELAVRLALVIVVPHVLEAGKLGLADDGVALRPGVLLGNADGEREDVRLAVL